MRTLRTPRALRSLGLAAAMLWPAAASSAHDLERTQVSIVFARDGSFVADVANDPAWLTLRLESVPGPFADRVVFWVDGREIRPESVELVPFDSPRIAQHGTAAQGLTTYRMRGHLPLHAQTLRWYYGLVIDPYPLTIRRADGRVMVEEVAGGAWSRTIDLSGQFHAPLVHQNVVGFLLAGLLLVPLAVRIAAKFTATRKP